MKLKTSSKKIFSLTLTILFLFSCLTLAIIPQAKAQVLSGTGSINQISPVYAWWPDFGSGTNVHLISYSGRACWAVSQPSDTLAIDAGAYAVTAGDRVVFVAQIQTSPFSDASYFFGIIGTDMVGTNMTLYNSPGRGTSDIYMTTNGNDNIESDYHSVTPQEVMGGTTVWTQRYQDGIIQPTYLVNQPNGGTAVY